MGSDAESLTTITPTRNRGLCGGRLPSLPAPIQPTVYQKNRKERIYGVRPIAVAVCAACYRAEVISMTTVRMTDLINGITQKKVEDGMPAWEARLIAKQEVGILDDQREIVPTSITWAPFQKRDFGNAILV